MNTITDLRGNRYEYSPETGLISKNDTILSGSEYEPVFSSYSDNSLPPIFVGIYFKAENRVMSMSGKMLRLIDSRQL